MCMEKLRNEIDEVNMELLKLLKKRFEIASYIGVNKKKQGIPIKDSTRELLMINDLKKKAEKLDIRPEFVENLFRLIIDETIVMEEKQ